MINYIIGKLVEIDENQLVIENNGIAYEVYFPKSNIRNLPNVGEELKIYTYMAVVLDQKVRWPPYQILVLVNW